MQYMNAEVQKGNIITTAILTVNRLEEIPQKYNVKKEVTINRKAIVCVWGPEVISQNTLSITILAPNAKNVIKVG